MGTLELSPELRDVCERIWRGRADLMRNRISPDGIEGLTIVVGEGIWRDIMAARNGGGVFERDYTVTTDEVVAEIRAWGIQVVFGGKDLMPREMFFRQEIRL